MDAFATPFAHLDMDAFYVEVERREDPSLVGVPVIVGGLGARGVVASASYEARLKGVRSAMPIVEARRRLPKARYLQPAMAKYAAMSRRVFAILDEFSPFVEPLSVDEAFLDISGLRLHYPSPHAVAVAMRARIREELDLPASVGIAAVKFLAKMASKEAKPDGLLVIPRGDEMQFLGPRPVTELWGVGQATLGALGELGVETVMQLSELPESVLKRKLGSAVAAHLVALANGRDPRPVEPHRVTKSVSVENTYPEDIAGAEAVEVAMLALTHRLSGRLRRAGHGGRTVQIKVRFGDFTTITRATTVDSAIADTSQIWPLVIDLLRKAAIGGRAVRLLGVGVTGLSDVEPAQLALDGSDRSGLAEVALEVRDRYGDDAVLPARLVRPSAETPKG